MNRDSLLVWVLVQARVVIIILVFLIQVIVTYLDTILLFLV